MKLSNSPSIRTIHLVTLFTAFAIAAATVGCSKKSKVAVNLSSPAGTSLDANLPQSDTVIPQTGSVSTAAVATGAKTSSAEKPPIRTSITYKSRDYGVSFIYPWQYSFANARTIAEGDASLRPKSDGHDSQMTLARIDIPKGYYPGTDFESGYFTLSLDQAMSSQQECEASLVVPKDGKVETLKTKGNEFHWVESESGGGGEATKLEQYVTFSNGTCYEFELGVKTSNKDGLAREVNPDKVLARLNDILWTVKIVPDETPATAQKVTSTEDPEAGTHN